MAEIPKPRCPMGTSRAPWEDIRDQLAVIFDRPETISMELDRLRRTPDSGDYALVYEIGRYGVEYHRNVRDGVPEAGLRVARLLAEVWVHG